MTDKEIYQAFMKMAGFSINAEMIVDEGKVLLSYEDIHGGENFTKLGYDEFFSGAIFDKDGNLVMGYLDSHVAFTSSNAKIIDKVINGVQIKFTN